MERANGETMKRIFQLMGLGLVFLFCTGLGGNNSGSSSGGGTTITSGAGAFGAGTSQTGGVLTGVLAAPYGASTYTVHGMLLGEAAGNIVAMAACAAGSFPYGQGAADPICSTLILPNAATQGDLLTATAANTVGSVADVAVGQVLKSGGVGTVPSYTANPAVSTVVLNGATSGTETLSPNAGAITSFTETGPAAVPAQGDLLTFSNGTGQQASVVDVAVGQVMISGGVGTVPAYSANPAVTSIATGTSPPTCTAGTGGVLCAKEGTASTAAASVDELYADSTAHTWKTLLNNGSAVNLVRSGMFGSSNAVVSNSAANFFPANGTGAPVASTLEGDVSTLAPWIATIQNLKCVLTTIAGVVTVAGGTNYVMALRQNIASSAITCTIATAASSCVDTTHSITTAVGDQLDYIDTPTGTPTALVVKCSVEVDF